MCNLKFQAKKQWQEQGCLPGWLYLQLHAYTYTQHTDTHTVAVTLSMFTDHCGENTQYA